MVTIRLEGSDQMRAALREMSSDTREAVSKAVIGTALELRGDVVKTIQRGAKTGRVYRKYNPSRIHQASAPGQAPASDTGRLANSITFERVSDLTASVGSVLAYATYLEYGTSRIAPRPFFRPAVERIRDKFNRRLEAAISGAIR